jgi:toxin ParE1/3/4
VTRVRWTTNAADDLTRIVEHIREDNPAAALRVARTIYGAVAELRTFPRRGRTGLAPNTRELIFPPWPYIAVYEIIDDQVNVLRIRHASRDWPH